MEDATDRDALTVDEVIALQAGLNSLLDRVETVQSDFEKLASEKKFLEDYIGNLMNMQQKQQKQTKR